jgi:hypothetical protein
MKDEVLPVMQREGYTVTILSKAAAEPERRVTRATRSVRVEVWYITYDKFNEDLKIWIASHRHPCQDPCHATYRIIYHPSYLTI